MKDLITLKINGQKVKTKSNLTILELAGQLGIYIPTLCYCSEFPITANCRICSVEVLGIKNLVPACSTKIQEGMEIFTHSPVVEHLRRVNLELLYLNGHLGRCGSCARKDNCDLLKLVVEYKAEALRFGQENLKNNLAVEKNPPLYFLDSLIFEPTKCVACRKCIFVCQKYGSSVIQPRGRGSHLQIIPPLPGCIKCLQCAKYCPTGAILAKKGKNLTKLNNL